MWRTEFSKEKGSVPGHNEAVTQCNALLVSHVQLSWMYLSFSNSRSFEFVLSGVADVSLIEFFFLEAL